MAPFVAALDEVERLQIELDASEADLATILARLATGADVSATGDLARALIEFGRGHWIARLCGRSSSGRARRTRPTSGSACPSAVGTTWLAMWRDLVRRYPDREARSMLEDLIALHGRKGKWFAAAKTAGYLDIALACAAAWEAAPVRAARDFEVKNPALAARMALHAAAHLRAGLGYDSSPQDIVAAVDHQAGGSTGPSGPSKSSGGGT